MGLPEIVDSGRFTGGRSHFSQTCSLLSQYLKEKGSFGNLSLGLTPKMETQGAPTATMNLFPMTEKSSAAGGDETQKKSDFSGVKSEAGTAPMTIFYAGQVIVFNDFPADKAEEIMMLASRATAHKGQSHHTTAFAPPVTSQIPADSTTSIQNIAPVFGKLENDLPIARKNSLARFLEKRKDRITANAPYQATKPAAAASKPVKAEPWLGLAPQLPLHMQRR